MSAASLGYGDRRGAGSQLAQALVPSRAYAQSADRSLVGYKLRLAALARQQGVREATIQANVPGLTVNQRVIELERNEPVARTSDGVVGALAPYLRVACHAVADRARAQANYRRPLRRLRRLEARYGVDPAVLMAIWGHETSYGTVTGSTDLLQALASLGYYGRRRDFFESEFVAALKLMDQGVPRWRLKGSWAGATGYPQFMPSVALRLRADGDGDGYADIWCERARRARLDRDLPARRRLEAQRRLGNPGAHAADAQPRGDRQPHDRAALPAGLSPPQPLADACANGGRSASRRSAARLPDNEMASLIEPDGPNQTAYLLTTNYRAILDYNCSNFYAISVGVLADAIARR